MDRHESLAWVGVEALTEQEATGRGGVGGCIHHHADRLVSGPIRMHHVITCGQSNFLMDQERANLKLTIVEAVLLHMGESPSHQNYSGYRMDSGLEQSGQAGAMGNLGDMGDGRCVLVTEPKG